MRRSSVNFWILFTISILISIGVMSLFLKMLKLVIFVILVAALAPIVYLLLRMLLPKSRPKGEDDKLKTRY